MATSSKNGSNKPQEERIPDVTVKLDHDQIYQLGLAFDALLKGTGVQFLDIVQEVRVQIRKQLPEEKKPIKPKK